MITFDAYKDLAKAYRKFNSDSDKYLRNLPEEFSSMLQENFLYVGQSRLAEATLCTALDEDETLMDLFYYYVMEFPENDYAGQRFKNESEFFKFVKKTHFSA